LPFIIVAPKNITGYILLGNTRDLSISDTIDYLIVSKNSSNPMLIDPDKKNKIYLPYDVYGKSMKWKTKRRYNILY
jgi:hypothetical protein